MRIWHGLLIVVFLMALPVMSGCASGSKISADEAIAIVKKYEIGEWGKGVDASGKTYYGFIGSHGGRGVGGEWHATYKGKGHWQITSYIKKDDLAYAKVYSWDYYEDSGIIDYRGVEYR